MRATYSICHITVGFVVYVDENPDMSFSKTLVKNVILPVEVWLYVEAQTYPHGSTL